MAQIENSTSRRGTIATWLGLGGVLTYAFALTWISGLRGVFPFDQSIVLDGAYRVGCGQVLYRDFYAPFGPVAFWYQAALFSLFGVSYSVYVLGAALLNTVGALSVYSIVRSLFREPKVLALGAATLTAAWLYAPFGTTYPEQTAFSLMLAGLALALIACQRMSTHPRSSAAWLFVTGSLAAAAVLSKHNAGLPALAVFGVAILAGSWPSRRQLFLRGGWFAAGFVAVMAAFAAWLYGYSNPISFRHYVLELPSGVGSVRLAEGGPRVLLRTLLTGKGSDEIRIFLFAWGTMAALWATLSWKTGRTSTVTGSRVVAAAMLSIALILFQNLFSVVSSNNGANEKPFLGLLLAIACGLMLWQWNERKRLAASLDRASPWQLPRWSAWAIALSMIGLSLALKTEVPGVGALLAIMVVDSLGGFEPLAPGSWQRFFRLTMSPRWLVAGTLAVLAYLQYDGMAVSLARWVHEPFEGHEKAPQLFVFTRHSTFGEVLDEPRLEGLHWGAPTRFGATPVPAADVQALIAHLRNRDENFFVFPDFTLLYAALDVPSPQPVLWFHRGLTYPESYSAPLDEQIVSSLRQNRVTTVVLEEDSFMGSRSRLAHFPQLERFIADEFEPDTSIGIFSIYRRRAELGRLPATQR